VILIQSITPADRRRLEMRAAQEATRSGSLHNPVDKLDVPSQRRMLALLGSLLAAMTGLVAYAPTLYQIFCAATGCGTRPDERIGNARRHLKPSPRNRLGHRRSK
jgi:hypothetical protein